MTKYVLHMGGPADQRQFALDEWAHTSFCPVMTKMPISVNRDTTIIVPKVEYARYEIIGDVAFYIGMEA